MHVGLADERGLLSLAKAGIWRDALLNFCYTANCAMSLNWNIIKNTVLIDAKPDKAFNRPSHTVLHHAVQFVFVINMP